MAKAAKIKFDQHGISVTGAFGLEKRVTSAANYTAKESDLIVAITDTSSARTVTLPKASAAGRGKVLIVKDESGAAGTNNITVDGYSTETIDGAATVAISTNSGSVRLYCTGAAWFTF